MVKRLVNLPVRACARCCDVLAFILYRSATLFSGLLPALIPPAELSTRIIRDYQRVYEKEPFVYDIADDTLESWETTVVERHRIRSGLMLVLGSGWGREALALAGRGIHVVGIDTSFVAVKAARRRALDAGVPAWFHQASFLVFPYKPAQFDYVLFGSSMYSTIPTRAGRQAWLRALRPHLKSGGRAILSFAVELCPRTGLRAARTRLAIAVSKLPGANHAYQPGDECLAGHFMHAFQTEQELRSELEEAGATVNELHPAKGYAVLTFSGTSHAGPVA
jgi:2-polyprenyl-3-methyl-5-hydroxy-6-metoxy-1,4-benzoquinol methylase